MVSRLFVNAYACAPELDVPYPKDGIQEPPSYRLHHQLYRVSTEYIGIQRQRPTDQIDSRRGRLPAISSFSRHCDSKNVYGLFVVIPIGTKQACASQYLKDYKRKKRKNNPKRKKKD